LFYASFTTNRALSRSDPENQRAILRRRRRIAAFMKIMF